MCRPFRDSTDEVTIHWIPADPKAKTLPFPSVMAIPDWDDEWQEWEGDVGMVDDAPRPFRNYKPLVTGPVDHVCGTEEDFRDGCVFDESLPPVLYGVQRLPDCCGAPVLPVGGVALGGAADVGRIPTTTVLGGLVVGGAASVDFYPPGPPPGSSCVDAPLVPNLVTVESSIVDTESQWWRWTSDGAHDYEVTFTGVDDSDVTFFAFGGFCPVSLLPLTITHSLGSNVWKVDNPPAGVFWLGVTSTGFTGDFSFVITPI